jgi:hypothetical protein
MNHVLVENVADWVEINEDDASSWLQDLVNSSSPSLITFVMYDRNRSDSLAHMRNCKGILHHYLNSLLTSMSVNQLTVP